MFSKTVAHTLGTLVKFLVRETDRQTDRQTDKNSPPVSVFLFLFESYSTFRKDTEPYSSVGNVADLRTGGRLFDSRPWLTFFHRIDDSHSDKILSSLAALHCFDYAYLGKQPVTCKEFSAEHWLK